MAQIDQIAQGLGIQQPQGQSRAQGIGTMLGAFGAGVQGNLPQFQQVQQQQQQMNQQQQQRQQEMAIERQKTLFTDAAAAKQLADQGNYDGVIQLGINRLQLLQQFPDANPEDTQRLTQLAVAARNGDEEAARLLKDELETTVEIGRATGVLQPPERETTNVSPGERVVDEKTGEVVYEAPPAANEDQRQQRINSLAQRLGDSVENPVEMAEKWVDGVLSAEVLDSGTVRLVDGEAILRGEGDKAVYELPINALAEPEREADMPSGLYDLAGETAGVASGLSEAWGRIAGQIGAPVPEDTLSARQTMKAAQERLINALRQNPRYSEGEAQRLSREVDIAPSIMDSPDALKARMRSIDQNLRIRMEQEEAAANDPQMPEDSRGAAREAARNIRDFLEILQVPQSVDPSEVTPEYVQQLDANSARDVIRSMTDEQLNSLSDEAYQSLLERLNGR